MRRARQRIGQARRPCKHELTGAVRRNYILQINVPDVSQNRFPTRTSAVARRPSPELPNLS